LFGERKASVGRKLSIIDDSKGLTDFKSLLKPGGRKKVSSTKDSSCTLLVLTLGCYADADYTHPKHHPFPFNELRIKSGSFYLYLSELNSVL